MVSKRGSLRKCLTSEACNAASKYHGITLNNKLPPGPDLLQKLVRILLEFLEVAVAITANIEQIVFQVNMKKEDTHCLRCLYSDIE